MIFSAGSSDKLVRQWDLLTGQDVYRYGGHHAEVTAMHYSRGMIFAASECGEILQYCAAAMLDHQEDEIGLKALTAAVSKMHLRHHDVVKEMDSLRGEHAEAYVGRLRAEAKLKGMTPVCHLQAVMQTASLSMLKFIMRRLAQGELRACLDIWMKESNCGFQQRQEMLMQVELCPQLGVAMFQTHTTTLRNDHAVSEQQQLREEFVSQTVQQLRVAAITIVGNVMRRIARGAIGECFGSWRGNAASAKIDQKARDGQNSVDMQKLSLVLWHDAAGLQRMALNMWDEVAASQKGARMKKLSQTLKQGRSQLVQAETEAAIKEARLLRAFKQIGTVMTQMVKGEIGAAFRSMQLSHDAYKMEAAKHSELAVLQRDHIAALQLMQESHLESNQTVTKMHTKEDAAMIRQVKQEMALKHLGFIVAQRMKTELGVTMHGLRIAKAEDESQETLQKLLQGASSEVTAASHTAALSHMSTDTLERLQTLEKMRGEVMLAVLKATQNEMLEGGEMREKALEKTVRSTGLKQLKSIMNRWSASSLGSAVESLMTNFMATVIEGDEPVRSEMEAKINAQTKILQATGLKQLRSIFWRWSQNQLGASIEAMITNFMAAAPQHSNWPLNNPDTGLLPASHAGGVSMHTDALPLTKAPSPRAKMASLRARMKVRHCPG